MTVRAALAQLDAVEARDARVCAALLLQGMAADMAWFHAGEAAVLEAKRAVGRAVCDTIDSASNRAGYERAVVHMRGYLESVRCEYAPQLDLI